MQDDRITKRIYKRKPIASKSSGRPKRREDDVMKDIKMLKIKKWISGEQNRTQWKSFVQKAKAFKE
ncbi:hypothetical protein C0J52_21829 [Blattella germanica]|nr:hypothetical protein C0J52_21829 [Blattella germanica]